MLDISVDDILPHRAPMLFVKGIRDIDIHKGYIQAAAICNEQDILFDAGMNGVSMHAAVEILAQAIGLLSGYTDMVLNLPQANMGKLLSIKHYQAFKQVLPINIPLIAEAKLIYLTHPIGVYECNLTANNELMAKAEITVIKGGGEA